MPRRKIFTASLLFLGIVGLGCSHTGGHAKRFKTHTRGTGEGDPLSAKAPAIKGGLPRYDVPMEINDRVMNQIHHLLKDRDRFSRYLSRSSRYEVWMKKILREEGVPQDVFYLAMIESGFSNHALSRANALGPWQFIRSTGRMFRLKSDYWVDERKDPEKATRAAARYLKRLHNEFGHWYLAMAAYNAGEGKIRRAIQQAGSKNFWVLSSKGSSYLKQETKDYVPRFIAAALMAKMPQRFGFRTLFYDEPFSFEQVGVAGPLDLTVAADLAGATTEEMVYLNPELNQFMTPPTYYHLRVPVGKKEIFQTAYSDLPSERRQLQFATYKVKRGDDLIKIAKHFRISSNKLASTNGLSGKSALKVGARIIIPKGQKNMTYSVSRPKTFRYRVKQNDNLTKIAKNFGVSVAAVKKENRIKGNSVLLGQQLKITKAVSTKRQVLLAYNEATPKKGHMDGVEWLIKKNQMQQKEEVMDDFNSDEESLEEAATSDDVTSEEVSADSWAEEPLVVEKGVAKAKSPHVEEIDLGQEASEAPAGPSVVFIPPMENAKTAAAPLKLHKVEKGDNLWKVSKKYGIRVDQLKEWNNMKGDTLPLGKTIRVTEEDSKKAAAAPVTEPQQGY